MSTGLGPSGKRGLLAGLSIMLLASGCKSASTISSLDPAITALLARYEQLSTFTGGCSWHRAKVAPMQGITGQLLLPDEHNPARFVPNGAPLLPDAARFGGAVAFPRDNPQLREQAVESDGDVRLSGTVVTGELRCYGNSAYNPGADYAMSAGFLVDAVEQVPRR